MGFLLADIDSTIVKNHVSIVFKNSPKPEADGFPLGGDQPLPLQFPPKITDDSKSANWNDIDQFSYEPIPIFKGASPRRITVEIVYIVTGASNGQKSIGGSDPGVQVGGPAGGSASSWSTRYIAQITKQVKAYFYRSIGTGEDLPIVKMRFYNHIGEGSGGPEASFRLSDVQISHGETLINDSEGVFPLFTKIRMTALLTTQIQSGNEKDPKLQANVPQAPKKQWY